ncbi:MAG: hypothetical protein QOD84_878 [Acidobacteriaceae bacterium]
MVSLDACDSQEYGDFLSHMQSVLRPATAAEKKLAEQAASLIWRLKKTEFTLQAALNCNVPKVKLDSVLRCEARFTAKLREVLLEFALLNSAASCSESQNELLGQVSPKLLKDGPHDIQ